MKASDSRFRDESITFLQRQPQRPTAASSGAAEGKAAVVLWMNIKQRTKQKKGDVP